MGLWERWILPRLVDCACRQESVDAQRERAVPKARGRVVELGIGSGLNLPRYDPRTVSAVVGVDPSRPLLERAARAARSTAVPVLLAHADARDLPVADGWADTVVVTFALCTIRSPERALDEARRVLAPGGRLLFVEHGLAPEEKVRKWQRRLAPAWRRMSGGCHLDRAIPDLVREAGFEIEEIDADWMDGPRIAGWTWRGEARPAAEFRSGDLPARRG